MQEDRLKSATTAVSFARAAAQGAASLLAVHLLTLGVAARAALATLPDTVRQGLQGVAGHMALFQLELAFAVMLAGAAFGVGARLLGARTRIGVGIVSLLLALLACARTVAHRPALFEDLLWRHGGVRAQLEVLLAERLGPHRLDWILGTALAIAAVVALTRQRRTLTPQRVVVGLAVALAIAAATFGPGWLRSRPHPYAGKGTAVIMLVADSLRPDHLSSEGYPRDTSPNIDALRKKGAFVHDFIVPLASTIPSWATFMTGVFPHAHGIRDIFPRAEQIGLQLPTLPRLLKEHGYESTVVSDYAGDMFSRVRFGFDTADAPPSMSLEVVAEREALQRLPIALGLLTGTVGERFFPIVRFLTNNADPVRLTDRAIDHLHELESTGKPFLLTTFYSVTHVPFAAPMPDGARYTRPDYQGPSRYSYDIQKFSDLNHLGDRPPDADVEQIRALYDGSVHAFDRELARMLATLDADGVTDRIVIVAGDHGENLFEPGATTEHGKWFEGGEASNRTVMLLVGTGVPSREIQGLRSGVDFAPTLLDLLRFPAPTMSGVSLLSPADPARTIFEETTTWLGGEADRPPHTLSYPAITALLEPEPGSHALVLRERFSDIAVTAKLRAARRGDWKLVYTPSPAGAELQLFDTTRDPFGEHDLAAGNPELVADLSRSLFEWMQQDPLRWMDDRTHLVARRER
jgi:arylsulfatase A-like enzyme